MYTSEKHPGGVTVMLWVSPKLGTPPTDMQRLVNQHAKLRCDLWWPNFRPPNEGCFKTEHP